jgi:hypothetical protein
MTRKVRLMIVDTRMTAAIAVAAIMAFGGSAPALAQEAAEDETTERLLACDKISDLTQRLVCFNSVVESLKESPVTPEVESPSASTADSVTRPADEPAMTTATPASAAAVTSASSAAAAAAVAAPAAASATTSAAPAAAPPDATAPDPVAVNASSPPDDVSIAPAESPRDPVDDFGRDGMRSNAEQEGGPEVEEVEEVEEVFTAIHATVVRSWRHNDGRFSVELDNGQVWRETQGSRISAPLDNDQVFGAPRSSKAGLPKVGGTVDISEGRLGSYRMRIEGIRQTALVRRTN